MKESFFEDSDGPLPPIVLNNDYQSDDMMNIGPDGQPLIPNTRKKDVSLSIQQPPGKKLRNTMSDLNKRTPSIKPPLTDLQIL